MIEEKANLTEILSFSINEFGQEDANNIQKEFNKFIRKDLINYFSADNMFLDLDKKGRKKKP